MEYRDLLAFVAVATLKSFSAGADQLHIAQSALSRRVHRLEQHLGVTLLERHARGVRVTKVGALLLAKAARLDSELRRIEQDIRAYAGAQPEEVRVAMPSGAARLFAGAIVAQYQLLCPNVRLHIFEKQSALNRESALRGEVDLALVYDAQPSEELSFTPLLLERILVIAPGPRHGDQPYLESYDVCDLARLPLILPGLPHAYRRIVENITSSHGFTPNIALEVNGFATSLMMVQQGLGFTISTYPPVQSEIEAGRLVGIPITSASCEVELSLVHRHDKIMSHAHDVLKAVIVKVSQGIEASAYWRPVTR
jgi:LysR family nitrogen assimilation transcriptional regulator